MFIERISPSETEKKLETILFFFGCSEVNNFWQITSELANPRARNYYSLVWYILIILIVIVRIMMQVMLFTHCEIVSGCVVVYKLHLSQVSNCSVVGSPCY